MCYTFARGSTNDRIAGKPTATRRFTARASQARVLGATGKRGGLWTCVSSSTRAQRDTPSTRSRRGLAGCTPNSETSFEDDRHASQ